MRNPLQRMIDRKDMLNIASDAVTGFAFALLGSICVYNIARLIDQNRDTLLGWL